ncbi:MAG TPA: type IV pilus secretin PilQ [Chromatiaceae bacterium]|jgi:type IV pilus assembly protein PilQ|nr:MAG: type IV pilus secretin PilQ [Thiohalocapsa sp. PB-PSB1]HBG94913.1 type IV pilus secretin PilQ [Chromatiaceae bacterium]HCS91845.1 type IV pilus secretin PilQ [Chromatiaceae bacterium]
MFSISGPGILRPGRRSISVLPVQAFFVGLLMLPMLTLAAVLEEVEFASLPGNQVEIDLVFSGSVPSPTDFATENPARIAIDFPGASSGLDKKQIPIGLGVAHSLAAIEASDRTRIVINLNDSVPYELTTRGNRVTIALNPERPTPVPRQQARGGDTGVSRVRAATRQAPKGAVKNIDFRRGADGEGRVVITLPSSETPISVREEGRDVVVDITNTQLPQRLFRRLDVVDFATPVVAIESRAVGSNVKIDIKTTEEYEYLAYQTDNLFTVEFRALTPAEKEQLERDKIVYSGDRLSLNFQDIEVRAVLQLLADFTALNLVASDTVRGNITLRLKNVPWDQALDIILKTKGLSMRQTGNVIMVAPTQEIAAQEKLELESKIQIEELAPLRSEFIQVNYAKASSLASLLKSEDNNMLTPDRGSVTVDARTNTLLVQDTAAKLEEVRRLVNRLDVPVRQVMIESRVVIANNDFARDLGVRFGLSGSMGRTGDNELLVAGGQPGHISTIEVDKGPFMGAYDASFYQDPSDNAGPYRNSGIPLSPFNSGIENPAGSGNDSLIVNLPAPTPSGSINFLLGKVGSHLLQLELSAMQREGRGEVISSPRVVTSDQNPAVIKVGQEIPYQEQTGGVGGGTSVAFKEAVLKLEVTPHITPDDRIIMDLQVNKDNPDFTRDVLGVPPVDTRSVETSVLVDNGETVVLGGVYEREKSFQREQVPWLGDLPVVGNLFKTTQRQDNNEELLIFVTPKILKRDMANR